MKNVAPAGKKRKREEKEEEEEEEAEGREGEEDSDSSSADDGGVESDDEAEHEASKWERVLDEEEADEGEEDDSDLEEEVDGKYLYLPRLAEGPAPLIHPLTSHSHSHSDAISSEEEPEYEQARAREAANAARAAAKLLPGEELSERTQRTVFVGNVPIATTTKQLKDCLSDLGEVEAVRFRSVPFADALKVFAPLPSLPLPHCS